MKHFSFSKRLARSAGLALVVMSGVIGAARFSDTAEAAPIANGVLARMRLFVNPSSPASRQAEAWQKSRPSDAGFMRYIASQASATWFGDWNSDVRRDVGNIVTQAKSQGALPVLVAYDIPNRDCGSYSAGGASDAARYGKWIKAFADGLDGRAALVVLEPDAVAGSDCLAPAARDARLSMLRDATKTLKDAGAFVYLDAGNAHWQKADVMADRLRKAGIDIADGFSLNVSNFFSTNDNISFGNDLSRRVGGKHYVIDTSRNGAASTNGQWCNPAGQALGQAPTTRTGHDLVDAFLWVKQPGESDGTCNGGPKAGQWWADYALGLAQRAGRSA
jgi:endoglucanase